MAKTADEAIKEVMLADLQSRQNETKKVLDVLRATRRARGGTGEPLKVPGHLAGVAMGRAIIVTDADLSPSSQSDPAAALNRNVDVNLENMDE